MEIQLEIQMGILNSKEITNEIKLSFQWIPVDISMKHQKKSIGSRVEDITREISMKCKEIWIWNLVEISMKYQWKSIGNQVAISMKCHRK